MADESFQERTEQATPKRREDARKKGQVARSAELSSFAVLGFSLLGFLVFGAALAQTLGGLAVRYFSNLARTDISTASVGGLFADSLATFGKAAAIPAAVAAIVGVGVAVLQVGWKPSFEALEIKWERFDIVKGLTRLVSKRSLFQLGRDTAKLAIIGWAGYLAIDAEKDKFPLFVDLDTPQIGLVLGGMALRVGFKITAALLVIATADYAFQKYDFEKNLRMTRQQVKEELKHTEGDPQIKARVRRVQRELSQRRMMHDARKADVVVTNPTHLAIALRYDRDTMNAPTVVAKGADVIAEKLKEIAREHHIPIIENRPLERALYRTVEIGAEIPEVLFEAAAGVLATAFRMRKERS